MPNFNKKGAILFIVIGIIVVVSILAIAMFKIVSNQAGVTDHQVQRIRAIYAAKAGMVFALDQLRRGVWSFPGSCPNPAGCPVQDNDFPATVRSFLAPAGAAQTVRVVFCPSGSVCVGTNTCTPPAGINFCVQVFADYTSP